MWKRGREGTGNPSSRHGSSGLWVWNYKGKWGLYLEAPLVYQGKNIMIQELISYCLFFLWQEKGLAKARDLFWHIPGGITIAHVLLSNTYSSVCLKCPSLKHLHGSKTSGFQLHKTINWGQQENIIVCISITFIFISFFKFYMFLQYT